MVKVLFICHGNICRSPMAEYIFRDMVQRQGLAQRFYIASAATSREEIGNDVYPPARAELRAHGVPVGHRAGHHIYVVEKTGTLPTRAGRAFKQFLLDKVTE